MTEDRAAKLEAIAKRIQVCTDCRLYEHATKGVPGAGDPYAEIMFIGEAPGYHEDQQGLPFVGRSGKYLEYLLELINLKRDQVFIANMVKHRPPENRDPLADELAACHHYLDEQFAVIDPLVIATLGRFSMEYYLGSEYKITRAHGQPVYREGRAFYPLFHPAAALRNTNLRSDMEADIKRIPEIIAEVKRRRQAGEFSETAEDAADNDTPPEQLTLF